VYSLVLIGGGEHARVVIDAARAGGVTVVGFVDPAPCDETVQRLEVSRLGNDGDAAVWAGRAQFILGVGTVGISPLRREIVDRLDGSIGLRWASVVHPRAIVSPSAELGLGSLVMPGAVIGPGARVGAHVVINTGAIVEHDCHLGDFAQLGPGAVLGGGVRVGTGAYVGLGSRVRDHVVIGAHALVGMGAVVVAEVAAGACVVGIPARPFYA
jgi:acetyltransferase EpsM